MQQQQQSRHTLVYQRREATWPELQDRRTPKVGSPSRCTERNCYLCLPLSASSFVFRSCLLRRSLLMAITTTTKLCSTTRCFPFVPNQRLVFKPQRLTKRTRWKCEEETRCGEFLCNYWGASRWAVSARLYLQSRLSTPI